MSKPHIRSISLDNFGFVGMKTVAEYKRLDELCHLNMGQAPDSNSYNDNGEGLPFYQGNADFGVIHPEVRVWCNAPTKIVDEGSLLISVRAPIGALNIANERCCIGRGLAGITSKDGVNQKYIYYCLKGKNRELNAKGTGSTFKAIAKNALGEVLVKVVSEEEQEKIVFSLDKITTIIESRKQQLQELDNLVKARFVEMFGDPICNPNGYPVKNFEDISVLITDGEHATPRRTEKGIYLLSARNILNHALQLENVDYIDEDEYVRIGKRVIPKEGDVLISCSGSIGRCCVVPEDFKFQMVRSVALIRFNETINPVFAEWLITTDEIQRQIIKSATQSSQANLFQGKIRKLHGYIPPIELQCEFADFVQQINKSKVIGLKRVS